MKHLVLLMKFCFLLCHYGRTIAGVLDDPDIYRNVSELITSKGYPLEEHTVQTKDGYILSIQRIKHGRNDSTQGDKKKVVLLIHGELGDAKTWFLNPPGQSLGYILPDKGYDVWLINDRGSYYSRKHVEYNTNEFRFWNFSFDEMGQYDLPATIDYILETTGEEKLSLIGYSRGNTVFFAMLSELPEYNDKVDICIALAPIAYIGHFQTIVKYLIPFAEEIYVGINAFTHGEFLPFFQSTKEFRAKLAYYFPNLFKVGISLVAGLVTPQLNETRLPLYSAQYLSTTSTKELLHFGQLYRSKEFEEFNYVLGNQKHYNQTQPPKYQLNQTTAPVALFWSTSDLIADTEDVLILQKKLPNVVYGKLPVRYPYNHFDFIVAKNAPKLIYDPVLELLAKHSNKCINCGTNIFL